MELELCQKQKQLFVAKVKEQQSKEEYIKIMNELKKKKYKNEQLKMYMIETMRNLRHELEEVDFSGI